MSPEFLILLAIWGIDFILLFPIDIIIIIIIIKLKVVIMKYQDRSYNDLNFD